jgi:hypothetical protein
MPYNAAGIAATLRTGTGSLQVTYESHIVSGSTPTPEPENILQTTHNYALLTCANPVVPPFLSPTEPAYQEAGGLVSPFFFKDTGDAANPNERTFFVQPWLTETTIVDWWWWAVPPRWPDTTWFDPKLIDQIKVTAQVPVVAAAPVGPVDPGYSIYRKQSLVDWATHPSTAIAFGNSWIGQVGRVNVGKIAAGSPGSIVRPVVPVGLNGVSLVNRLGGSGRFTLVGGQGLRLGQLQNVQGVRGSARVISVL